MKGKKLVLLLVGGLLGLCLCVVLLGALSGSSPNGTATASPQAVVEATKTALPTNTAVPPTETPKPEAGPPLEVRLYLLEVVEKGGIIANALTAFGELMMKPQLGDQDWIVSAAVQMVTIQTTHKELEEMHVPPGMAEVHEGLLDGTQDCYDSMDYVASGIDNLDVDNLEKARELMESCTTKVGKLPAMLEEYMAQYE